MSFFSDLQTMINGCLNVMNIPIVIGGFHLTLIMILMGSVVIALVAKLIWGVLE